jgi:hypothetical protein
MGRGWGDPDYNRLRDAITQRLWDDPSRPSRPGADWSDFLDRIDLVEIASEEHELLMRITTIADLRAWVEARIGDEWGDDRERLIEAITQRLWGDPGAPRTGADWYGFLDRTDLEEIANEEHERLGDDEGDDEEYERLRKWVMNGVSE